MFHKHFAHFGRQARFFEKGDLKYVILNLLKDKPSHGYEIIRALEETFHGLYTPSPGSVYPTLQMLEDMGYVSLSERDTKKVYTITDEGTRFLEEQKDVIDKINEQIRDWREPRNKVGFHNTIGEFRKLWQMIGQQSQHLGPEKWADINEVVTRARQDIEKIIEK